MFEGSSVYLFNFQILELNRPEKYGNTESVLLTKLHFQVSVISLIETFFSEGNPRNGSDYCFILKKTIRGKFKKLNQIY